MGFHERHFRVEQIDHQRVTMDCGVRADFIQEIRARASAENTKIG